MLRRASGSALVLIEVLHYAKNEIGLRLVQLADVQGHDLAAAVREDGERKAGEATPEGGGRIQRILLADQQGIRYLELCA